MKVLTFAATLLLLSPLTHAASSFPGLRAIMSDAEWKRAGLDTLTADQIGVIDAAVIRHEVGATRQLQTELAAARKTAEEAAASATEQKRGILERFGLPTFENADWRSMPPLVAKVVKWEGGNRFSLDNGQVWQGDEPIVYDIVGKDIQIQARPHGRFALVVDGVNTTLRVSRVR